MTKGVRVENKKTLRLISDLRSLNISFSKIAEILNRQEIRTIYGKKSGKIFLGTKSCLTAFSCSQVISANSSCLGTNAIKNIYTKRSNCHTNNKRF